MRQLVMTLLAAGTAALALVSPTVSAVSSSSAEPAFSMLQMNLCLSGQAGCYERAERSAVLDEASAQILEQSPSAVTINEACRGDAAALAQHNGYDLSFAPVHYGGTPLPCIDPRGRGVFGIAVLTRDGVASSRHGAFDVQADPEERRWLCATTDREVTVCTAHLGTRNSARERVANDAECRELRHVLAQHERGGTTFFGGDVNRQSPCSPATMSVTRDDDASQVAGVQHVYGSRFLGRLSASVTEASYTDHDFLLAVTTEPD